MSRVSVKPSVWISATGGNLSSTMALVTRVVPWIRSPTCSNARPTAASASRIAVTGASGRLGTLALRSAPLDESRATTSVKVPPISMPTRQVAAMRASPLAIPAGP